MEELTAAFPLNLTSSTCCLQAGGLVEELQPTKAEPCTAWRPLLFLLSTLDLYPLLYNGTLLSNLQQILWQGRGFSTLSHLLWYLRADRPLFVPVSNKFLYKPNSLKNLKAFPFSISV